MASHRSARSAPPGEPAPGMPSAPSVRGRSSVSTATHHGGLPCSSLQVRKTEAQRGTVTGPRSHRWRRGPHWSPAPKTHRRPHKSKDAEHLSQPPPPGQETAPDPTLPKVGGQGGQTGPWPCSLLGPFSERPPHPSGLNFLLGMKGCDLVWRSPGSDHV